MILVVLFQLGMFCDLQRIMLLFRETWTGWRHDVTITWEYQQGQVHCPTPKGKKSQAIVHAEPAQNGKHFGKKGPGTSRWMPN